MEAQAPMLQIIVPTVGPIHRPVGHLDSRCGCRFSDVALTERVVLPAY